MEEEKVYKRRSRISQSDSINQNNGNLHYSKSWPDIQTLGGEENYINDSCQFDNFATFSNRERKEKNKDDNFVYTEDLNIGTKRYSNWTLSDAVERTMPNRSASPSPCDKFPMTSFNHIAREVLSLERSKRFYVDILGFEVIPRPPFDSEGYWLNGYGLNLHLVGTSSPAKKKEAKARRIQLFTTSLPKVDHIAFLTNNLNIIRDVLDREKVYYKEDSLPEVGINQIFFFDPDGNVIEISNCAPDIGEVKCNIKKNSTQKNKLSNSDSLSNESHLMKSGYIYIVSYIIILIFLVIQIINFVN